MGDMHKRKIPDRSSYISIAMSLMGIVEDKLANSVAQRIRFVYPLISRRYFLSLGRCVGLKMLMFRLSMIDDHDFPAAPRLMSKTKYLIFSPEHGSGISCSRGRKPLNLVYSIVA